MLRSQGLWGLTKIGKRKFGTNSLLRHTKLPSGIRVQTETIPGPTASVAVVVNTGSAHENEENNGVAHFLEHLAFKVITISIFFCTTTIMNDQRN